MKKSRCERWLFGILIILLCSQLSLPCAAFASEGPPLPRTLDELRARLQAIAAEEKVPGAGIALVSEGRVLSAFGVGYANLENKTEVTADTKFRAGSITKSFVALALLQMVQQGRLDLQTPVRDLAPELVIDNPFEATHPLRVVHLLEHTAGFDDLHPNEVHASHPDMSLREVLAFNPRSRVVRWPPGTRFAYSNPGYTVAAYLLEKISRQRWDQQIQDSVLLPLGMTHATLRLDPAQEPMLSRGYDGWPPAPVSYVQILHGPAGNLVVSPAELAHLVQFWLDRGRYEHEQVLSKELLARMEVSESLPASFLGLQNLYGVGNSSQLIEGLRVYGHNGAIDGFVSTAGYVPEHGIGWVILLNTFDSDALRKLQKVIIEFLMIGRTRTPLPPPVVLSSKEQATYGGTYRLISPRLELIAPIASLLGAITLSIQNGVLQYQTLGQSHVLIPLGNGRFRKEDEAGASLLLTVSATGKPVLVQAGAVYERSSAVWLLLQRAVLVVVLFGSLSALGFFLVWGARWVLSARYRQTRGHMLRMLVTLGSGLFVLCLVCLSTMQGMLNFRTLLAFLSSLAFVVLAVVGAGLVLQSTLQRQFGGRIAQVLTFGAALSNLVLAVYLLLWNLVGLRLWTY